ncbi:MAG TPA: S8 family peptidase [Pseudobdellovibrionaceae bacterium]|nr:S8 family peptidase [Pseudobdellovibrionaceae bacterium]
MNLLNKNKKWIFGAILLLLLFKPFLNQLENNPVSRKIDRQFANIQSDLQSNSNVKNRLFEESQVKSKISKIKDEPSALFNDPSIKEAWGLKKSDAARAWSISKGSRNIVVAIIDTGIDIHHEDLKNNLWTNLGETGKDKLGRDKSTNGIDDDKNGHIDDVYGWNFVSDNNDLKDNHGHGTHISGIVGAEAQNGKGISGISPEVSIMTLKYYDPQVLKSDNLKNTIRAIHYAISMGAHIINYSGGGTEKSEEEKAAVMAAEQKGILFVAAAGNEKSNSDEHHYYPADYKLSNIISVTAIDPNTEVLASSNYGTETVDIAAPGQNILSTLPSNNYGYMTGTSQATAFVTGAAVLAMAHKKNFSSSEIKKYILATGDTSSQLLAKTRTARQLNLFKVLSVLDQGVAANGVLAVNPSKEQESRFLSNEGSKSPLGAFGGQFKEALQKVMIKEKIGNKND